MQQPIQPSDPGTQAQPSPDAAQNNEERRPRRRRRRNGGQAPEATNSPAAERQSQPPTPEEAAGTQPRRRRGRNSAKQTDPAQQSPAEPATDPPEGQPDESTTAASEEGRPRRRRRRGRSSTRQAEPATEELESDTASQAQAEEDAAAAGEEEQLQPQRRRGQGSRQARPTPEAPPEPEPPRTRRPRRATKADASEATTEPQSLETLLAEQQKLLVNHMATQAAILRSIQNSTERLREQTIPSIAHLAQATEEASIRPKVAIFVDVPNVLLAAERIGVTLDYGKMLARLSQGRHLVRASAYSPIRDDTPERSHPENEKFVAPFMGKGYRIVTKPLRRFADGSVKANFDVELAIDMLTMSERLDIVSLVSGDGDFCRLVELVQSKGVRVEVVAFPASTSFELRALADEYVDLEALVHELRVG